MAQDEYQYYVDGEWTDSTGDKTFGSANSAAGESLGTLRRDTPEDVDATAAAADGTYGEWYELSRIDRAEYPWDIYHEPHDRTGELVEIATKECGKEISEGHADVIEAYRMVE